MRLTPLQIGVRLICGEKLPPFGEASIAGNISQAARIKKGRDLLAQIAGQDFEYDLAAWHGHLKESRMGGYTWSRNIALPKVMKTALASKQWRDAVRELQRDSTLQKRKREDANGRRFRR